MIKKQRTHFGSMCYYPGFEHAEIEANLNKIYTLLHSDGDVDVLPF